MTLFFFSCKSVSSSSSTFLLLQRASLILSRSHPSDQEIRTIFSSANIIAQLDMEKHPYGKMDPAMERCNKEVCDFSPRPKRVSDAIMPHILKLYASCATARDFEIYAADATFEDPLMRANGLKQIKSAFYSLPKVFSESKIVEYSVKENLISPGKYEILVDNRQHYRFLGRHIDMISLIRLYVEEGKVVRHEDWWDKKPLRNRDTVKIPLVGRTLEAMRRGSMLATHVMMGFGKDPHSENGKKA